MLLLRSWTGIGGYLCGNRLPVAKSRNRTVVYTAVVWVNAWKVDLADEVNDGWLGGVFGSAVDSEFVDSVLVVAL